MHFFRMFNLSTDAVSKGPHFETKWGGVRQRRLCYTAADGFGGFGKTGKMRIGDVYILSRRSIARMLATITAALAMLYAATTA